MDTKQIISSLEKKYNQENNRIVFWYDEDKEFEEVVPSLNLDDVKIVNLDETGSLELKLKLELEDIDSKYLLYAPFPEPDKEEDWLLDIKLYSDTFHADKASIVVNELGLKNQSMRNHIRERYSFFRSQERINRLKKWVSPDDTENNIDLKILAVLTKADHPDYFAILMKLFSELCEDDRYTPDKEINSWEDIKKYNLTEFFWEQAALHFDYTSDSPSLNNLIIKLLVTDLDNNPNTITPQNLSHFVIKQSNKVHNISVFLSQWRNNYDYYPYYNIISTDLANELNIKDSIYGDDLEHLIEVMTFEEVEREIIRNIKEQIINNFDMDKAAYLNSVIETRLDGHWASKQLQKHEKENPYKLTYNALGHAIELFSLRHKYDEGFSYPTPEEMFKKYTTELCYFDQYYRKFYESADKIKGKWDILKDLKESIEDCYSDWFIDHIALTWDGFLDPKRNNLINSWKIDGINNQYNFYKNYVAKNLKQSSRNRVFIVISDALRFEAGEELKRKINQAHRFNAKIEPNLGVLPSYTSLGMASLLPHQKIEYKKDDLLVDDNPTKSFENRQKILANYNGTAIKYEELIGMNKQEGREFVKPYEVVYIYHDGIDAVGDSAKTEHETFEAVEETIDDLIKLTNFIINNLNGSLVFVTSDHGFFYQGKTPTKIDKSKIEIKSSSSAKSKRFLIDKNLSSSGNVWHGNTKVTAKTENEVEFIIPKGANRFNFHGGSKYFHGGAMLQEIVVPVITIQELGGRTLEKAEKGKVGVSLLGDKRKIVNNITKFEFIQTESITENLKPRTLKISLRDGEKLVSDEITVTFDSESNTIEDRKKAVRITLQAIDYEPKKEYYLVLRNADDDIEYGRYPIYIDLGFGREF